MSDLSPSQTQALHVGLTSELPHDPLALVLYGRCNSDPATGFAAAALEGLEIDAASRSMRLAPGAGCQRSLSEPSGSFGGLRPPTNVAVARNGDIYLSDHTSGAIKYFDPCECAFMSLPCFASLAAPEPGPRGFVPLDRLREPNGLAVAGSRLLIADTGNHRLVVMRLVGAVPSAALRLPASTGRRGDWAPFAVVVDGEGSIWVSDRLHGRLDRFDAAGRWLDAILDLGEVAELAVDCAGSVYVVVRGVVPRILKLVGGSVVAEVDPNDHLPDFPKTTARTDARGRLHLSCANGTIAIFDGRGGAVSDKDKAALMPFAKLGSYLSNALDSRRRGCVWHRIALAGSLPERCRIEVQTTTSDVELNAAELTDLPAEAWSRPISLRSMERGIGDVLVMSSPGRYLWLRLRFAGDGRASPVVVRIVVEFPRVSLRRFLPDVFGMDMLAADFTDRFTALFDTTLRSIEQRIDTGHELFSASTAPAEKPKNADTDFLSWLAGWVGVTLNRHWPETVRRRLLKAAASTYALRGTRYGLWKQLIVFLCLDRNCEGACPTTKCRRPPLNCAPPPAPCESAPPPLILEHFRLRRWMFLGAGKLGDDAMLWGDRIVNRSQLGGNGRLGPIDCPADGRPATRLVSTPDPLRDPFLHYAHRLTVFVPSRVRMRDWQRRGLEQLLRQEVPAHVAWDVAYVEPRFRVGVQAMIGLDSVIARVPEGLRLGANQLGQGTVLPPHPGRPPIVGIDTRVGPATSLI